MTDESLLKLQRKRKHWFLLHLLTILCATLLVIYSWYEARQGFSVRMGYVIILIAFQVFSLQQIQIRDKHIREIQGEPDGREDVREFILLKLLRILFGLFVVLGAPATVILSFVYFYRLLMKIGEPETTFLLGAYMLASCYLICLSVSVISLLPGKKQKSS
jgi:4-amino-4-deoxy-L-arabinose transferase-like glycosyltransferase